MHLSPYLYAEKGDNSLYAALVCPIIGRDDVLTPDDLLWYHQDPFRQLNAWWIIDECDIIGWAAIGLLPDRDVQTIHLYEYCVISTDPKIRANAIRTILTRYPEIGSVLISTKWDRLDRPLYGALGFDPDRPIEPQMYIRSQKIHGMTVEASLP